ncbi:MAG: ParA family protein, partial [Pontixanthobacter sp.]
MPTIAIYSVKGGVGKTTIAVNLAWCSAAMGDADTIVWDCDPSGGSAFLLNIDGAADASETPRFRESETAKMLRGTPVENLRILPADCPVASSCIGRVADTLEKEAARIFIDCPPVRDATSSAIVQTADLIVVPLPPSPLSTRAFTQVAAQVKALGKSHPPMLPVLSMVDR